MNVIALIVFLSKYLIVLAEETKEPKLNYSRKSNSGLPRLIENDLPRSGPLVPGHSLIRPAKTMLKSAVKFPHEDKNLVYGNLENLGITIDQANNRILATSFRKENIDLVTLLKAFERINDERRNNTNIPVIFLTKPEKKSKTDVNSKLKGITLDVQKLLQNINQANGGKNKYSDSFKSKSKSKSIVPNKLKEITMKALNYIHKENTVPVMKTASDLSGESNKEDIIIKKAINLLTEGNPSKKKRQKSRMKEKEKMLLKKLKINKLLAKKLMKAQEESSIDSDVKSDETLHEKTKQIQEFLNKHIPVMQAQSLKEDTPHERYQKVSRFLNTEIPGGMSKLSLDEKSQYIEDFLNNRVPRFVNADSYTRQRKIPSFFKGRDLILTNAQYPKDLNTTAQALISGQQTNEDDENNANEIVDRYSQEKDEEEEAEVEPWPPQVQRRSKSLKKYRKRDSKYESKSDGDSDVSASSDYEKNPGNPYTIHKNKYIQNWMWNHFMDGDHMNINPFGPPFASLGPTGADLFFGRKWWYFNQDDYKPMG